MNTLMMSSRSILRDRSNALADSAPVADPLTRFFFFLGVALLRAVFGGMLMSSSSLPPILHSILLLNQCLPLAQWL
jgi:hypothetical protein